MTHAERYDLMMFMKRDDVYQLWRELGEPKNYYWFGVRMQDFLRDYDKNAQKEAVK